MYTQRKSLSKGNFSVSIQASGFAYCSPRDNYGPWTSVELGFPTVKPPDFIMDFAEDEERPTDTVYGYVPVFLVCQWLMDVFTKEELEDFGFQDFEVLLPAPKKWIYKEF